MDEWMVILMFYNTATKPGALAPSRGQTKTDMSSSDLCRKLVIKNIVSTVLYLFLFSLYYIEFFFKFALVWAIF